jgi:hypothetical protein
MALIDTSYRRISAEKFAAMLDVLDKTKETAQPAQSQEAPLRRWSAGRTLIFIIVTSTLLWGAIIFGAYGILHVIAPR